MTWKGHEETLPNGGNVPNLECVNVYLIIYICPNSLNCTVKFVFCKLFLNKIDLKKKKKKRNDWKEERNAVLGEEKGGAQRWQGTP